MRLRILLFLFISSITNVLAQQSEVTIHSLPDSAVDIRPYLQIFADESTVRTWEEVYGQKEAGNFKPFANFDFKPILERGKYDYWFYFSIDFKSKQTERILIRKFGDDSLICHHLKDGQLIYQRKAGNDYQNDDSESPYAYLKNDIPLTLHPGKNEFLVFIRPRPSYYPKYTQPVLLKEAFAVSKADKYLLLYFASNGFFFGVLAFVILYSIVQYFQIKDRAFLFYALYVASLFLYFLRYFSFASQYFYFLPPWAMSYEQHNLFNYPIFITYMIFLRVFLDTPKRLPQLERIIKIALGLILSYFVVHRVLQYINFNWAFQMNNYVRITYLVLGIAALFTLFKNQNKLVKYVLAGSFSLIFMTLIGLILIYKDDHYWLWWEKANTMAQIGALLELFCFSMGLGYKTQLIEKERNQVKNDLELKQQEARQLKELDQFKDRFYTNISHEFRTPLTVIQGLAQQLQEEPNKDLHKRSELIQSNSHNLLNLVNQLLDLSKAEVGQLELNFIQKDIIKYIGYISESFHSLAYTKKINLSFYTNVDKQLMDYDPTIIKSLLTNLIANALKFTPEYGKIMVVTDVLEKQVLKTIIKEGIAPNSLMVKSADVPIHPHYLRIKVMDTGNGIDVAQLPNIFDRFYQADQSSEKVNQGTGLGLALTKELILLLNGFIKVESTLNEGSTFSIYLPVHQKAPLEASLKTPKVMGLTDDQLIRSDTPTLAKQEIGITKPDKPILLIAEDNADVIYYLKSCVGESYEVLEARNGKIALDLALQHIPDIILSDVMMPELDGFQLCAALKNDARTSHIPIVLLTAKATQENKKTGLASGADAYLIKPFDKNELLIRLENLVLLRKQMQLFIQLNAHSSNKGIPIATKVAEKEIEFLRILKQTVEKNIQDDIFKAPQLARAMAMSPTQLYRKIKALTNQATAQYIRSIRLEAGKKLLETTDFSIGRISLEVGFKNQAHFSKAFQKEYGVLPSEIRK